MTYKLPSTKVTLQHNPASVRKNYMGHPNHEGAFMFPGTSNSWTLPTYETGRYIEPFKWYLDDIVDTTKRATERNNLIKFLEESTGYKLDIDKKDNSFGNFFVTIRRGNEDLQYLKMELDLSNPLDFLRYSILRSCPDVAPSWGKRTISRMYRWILVEPEEQIKETVNLIDYKKELYTWLTKVENSQHKMYVFLKLYGLSADYKESVNSLKAKIGNLIESGTKTTLQEMINLTRDNNYEDKQFLIEAQQCGIVRQEGGKFYVVATDGTMEVSMGARIEDAIGFLSLPENNVIETKIKAKIAQFKKENNIK